MDSDGIRKRHCAQSPQPRTGLLSKIRIPIKASSYFLEQIDLAVGNPFLVIMVVGGSLQSVFVFYVLAQSTVQSR